VANYAHEYTDGNLKITIAQDESGEVYVGNWKNDKLVRWASVDEFGDNVKSLIGSNPQEAARVIAAMYQKESGVTMSKTNKIASGDSSQHEVATQAQLDKAGPLHPRENKYPTVITEARLGGEGELPAIKDVTSASPQLRQDKPRDTILEAQLDSIKDGYVVRWGEYPDVITEAQWTEMSRRVSSSLPSDYTEQAREAQLESLQKSHKWTPPEVITQSQLDNQKKVSPEGKSESYRWASSAKDLVKAATSTVVDAIANYGLSPSDIRKAYNTLTSSPQSVIKASYLTLINAVPSKIEERLASNNRRFYFAKNAGLASSLNAVDSLLASMGDNIGYLKAEDLIDALGFVVNDKKAFASAENKAHVKMASVEESAVVDKNEIFRNAFSEMDRPQDGKYKISGTIAEDVKSNPDNQVEFLNSLFAFAKTHIDVPFVISKVNLDKEAGVFEIECKEEGVCSDQEKKAFAASLFETKVAKKKPVENGDDSSTLDEDGQPIDDLKNVRASNRQKMVKESQMMGGQMGGGMGGGGPQAGAGATMPGADAAQGMPPTESLGGPLSGTEDDGDPMTGDDDGDMQPKPPGTLCPVCGSSDCDVLDGKSKCNNCSAEWEVKIQMLITKHPGILDSGKEEESEEGGEKGEGFALPESNQPASIPVAAMTKITNQMIKKASEDFKAKGLEWSIGCVSPYTGSNSVMKLSDNEFMCLDTGNKYKVLLAGVENKGKKVLFAEWQFEAKPLVESCESCRRQKSAFVSALKSHGIDEQIFDAMPFKDKAKTILSMQQKGLLNTVKTASSDSGLLNDLRKTASFGSKFPIETCREKIARKYGENALAMSGPCEGKNLADCVCKKLSMAGVYSNSIALKVASVWSSHEEIVECVEDFVRTGLSMKKACFVCDQLKNKYAQFEDRLADEVGLAGEQGHEGGSDMNANEGASSNDISDSGDMGDIDPFAMNESGSSPSAEGEGSGVASHSVVVELPLSTLQDLDEALDKALGENPSEEAHHEQPLSGEAVLEVPESAVQQIDQVADQALDAAVGVAGEAGGVIEDATDAIENAVSEAPGGVDPDPVSLEADETEVHAPSDSLEDSQHDSSHVDEENKDIDGDESSDSEKFEDNHSEKEDSSDDFENNESQEEFEMKKAEKATDIFRKGKISATGKINLDLSGVMNVISKQSKSTKTAGEVTFSPAQDDKDIGKISGDSVIGHEEKFKAEKPDVFSGDATMGGEKEVGLGEKIPAPSFDSGGAEMGSEKDSGYTAEKQNKGTGGDKGSGKSANSTKSKTASLAERITNATKTASDKKIEDAKPVSETEGIGEISSNKDNPKSGNPIKPFEDGQKLNKSEVQKGDSSLMGHEKETLVHVPKENNSAPSVPAGGGMNPKYDHDKKNSPEKETEIKGTVIAGSDEETLAIRKAEATRVAGRKLKAGKITIDDLAAEIEKLSRYDVSDLRDLENSIFGAVKKGLDTVAKGSERALIISEKSNYKNPSSELKDSIQSLFNLDKMNKLAESNQTTEMKRLNDKIRR
jgi:hypothetical protein